MFGGPGQNSVINETSSYATSTGSTLSQQWSTSSANAICYQVSTSPVLTSVQFSVTPSLAGVSATAHITATLTQNTTGDYVDYANPQAITLSGATATLSNFSTGDDSECLDDTIDNGTATTSFSYSLNSDITGTTHSCATSPNDQILTTLDAPNGGVVATYMRLNYWCSVATGKSTEADVVNAIGPDATNHNRFDPTYSMYGTGNGTGVSYIAPWAVMDGTGADCITLSTLMKQSLDVMGVATANSQTKFVIACHNSWANISSTNGALSQLEHRVANDNTTVLGFESGGWNIYEGCCLFGSQWWMGGSGANLSSAQAVLRRWSSSSVNPSQRQVYADITGTAVSYPDGTF